MGLQANGQNSSLPARYGVPRAPRFFSVRFIQTQAPAKPTALSNAPSDLARDAMPPAPGASAVDPYAGGRDPTPVLDPALEASTETSSLATARPSWAERLKAGLGLSREKLSGAITGAFRRRVLDDEALDELESALLTADAWHRRPGTCSKICARYRRAGTNADP
jgi:hypothetical protein